MMTEGRKAVLLIDGKDPVEFPILTPTHGNECIDLRSLGAKTGFFTYDSGFLSTASCQSTITFIDGEKGELLYRGYPIEELAEHCNFLDVAYLLKHGDLPIGKFFTSGHRSCACRRWLWRRPEDRRGVVPPPLLEVS